MNTVTLDQPVLMVDDSQTDVIIAKRCYEKSGATHPFKAFSSGQGLINYLESIRDEESEDMPLVVLLDLNMPVMDGFETLQRVRKSGRYAKPPPLICIFTNSDDPKDKQRALELGADAFRTKPSLVKDYIGFFQALLEKLEGEEGYCELGEV